MTKYFIFIVLLTTLYCKKYLIEIEDKKEQLKQVNMYYSKIFLWKNIYRDL